MDFKDYYQTLGVAETAKPDEIKRAYKKLARKLHPDVNKEAGAESRFKDLGEAYEVLEDEKKRAAYDRARARASAGERLEPAEDEVEIRADDLGDYSDFFAELFGRSKGRARPTPRDMRGRDQHVQVEIELEDALRGAQRTITLQSPAFDAEGHVELRSRTLDITIPKGIREGQHLRLARQGSPGMGGGTPGDLYLEVRLRPHPLYRVDGRDLYFDLALAPWEAALGGPVPARVPGGAAIELTVPAGSTAGRKLRIKGKGFPGTPPGDAYAVLAIVVPPADTDATREAYQAFKAAFPAWNPREPRDGGTP